MKNWNVNFESLMKLALINNIFAFEKCTPLLEGKTVNRSGDIFTERAVTATVPY